MAGETEKTGGTVKEESEENFKVKTTGLGAIFNYIKENKETLSQETQDTGSSWSSSSVPLELLCDVGAGIPKSRKAMRVSSFWCDTCQLDLNSQVTYNAHITGAKHQKKARNQQQQQLQQQQGEAKVKPSAAKKNSNIRLMLEDNPEPALGLQYIVEVFPESNESGDNDAMYLCELCCTDGPCGSIFSHVLGSKHREKYLSMKYNIRNLEKQDIVREAKRVEKLEGRRIQEIKTIFDDIKYPWPTGRRPEGLATKKRALEEDDDDDKMSEVSASRDFARRGYNFEKHKPEEPVKTSLTESKISRVLTALRSCQVKTEEDVEMAHQVSAHLIRALTDYKESTGDPTETRHISAKCDKILNLLYSIRKIPSTTPLSTDGWAADVVDYGHGKTSSAYATGGVGTTEAGTGGGGYGEDRLYGAGTGGGVLGGDRPYGGGLGGAGSDGARFGGGGYTTTSYQERSGLQPGYTEPERTGLEGGSVMATRDYSGNGSFSTNEPGGVAPARAGFSLPKPTAAAPQPLGGGGAGRGNGYSSYRGYSASNSDYSSDRTKNWRGGGYGAKW